MGGNTHYLLGGTEAALDRALLKKVGEEFYESSMYYRRHRRLPIKCLLFYADPD